MVRWVVGSILHFGPIGIFLVSILHFGPICIFLVSTGLRLWYVLSCLWDGAFKIAIVYDMSEMWLRGKSVHSCCDGSSDRSLWGGPIEQFSFQPVLHDWCNKGRGMCYHVNGIVHIKEPLLLIGKSSLCGGSGFPLTI